MKRIAALLAVLALLGASCGGSDEEAQAGAATASTAEATTTTNEAPPETITTSTTTEAPPTTQAPASGPYPVFAGGDFYAPPDPLPAGTHGDLIWVEEVDAPTGARGWKVLYLSENTREEPIAVSGYVMVPDGAPPPGGWPVISWAHGTTGLADQCAPSFNVETEMRTFFPFTTTFGVALVATDYEGLGTPGRHAYIVGESAGRTVVDIVTAARQIPEANLSADYAVWGHSQGGHAALWAGQVAADGWAPEMTLVGVAAGAPPFDFAGLYDFIIGTPRQGYLTMTTAAYEPLAGGATQEDVLTDEALAVAGVLEEGCLGDIQEAFEPIATLFKVDNPLETEPWATIIAEQVPAQTPITAPVLILHGEADDTIPLESSADLLATICAAGGSAQRITYPDKPHGGELVLAYSTDLLTWLTQRFDGTEAASDC